jgi:hypothetical protein
MSLTRKRTQRRATLIGALIGFIIIFTFVISLIAPDRRSGSNSSDNIYPTLTPYGTPLPPTQVIIPTPEPNPQLEGELPYIHSSGFFQTFRPAGSDWFVTESLGTENTTSTVIQSPARLAVIHNYIRPGVQYETLESLSTEFLNEAHFVDAWVEYDSWLETGRTVTGDHVIISFDLMSEDNQYLGRAIAWVEAGWLYISRLVVPANNPALLDLLQSLVIPVFRGYPQLQVLPQSWPAYIDQELGFLLKHPLGWQTVAGGRGRPVTFNVPAAEGKTAVRVWTAQNRAVGSGQEAEAFLTETEPTATTLTIEPVEHGMGTGYQIAYAYRDTAGDLHSGLMMLLNDTSGMLFVANLQSTPPGTNWLDAESLSEQDGETAQALINGFVVLPDDARQPEVVTDAPETASPSPTASE